MRNIIRLVAISLQIVAASSASAGTIWQHEGKNDPATEGWTYNTYVTVPPPNQAGPVGPGESEVTSEDAWKYVDPGNGVRPTYETARMTSGQVANLANGWEYEVRMHVPAASTINQGAGFQFIEPGDPATAKIYRVYVSTNASSLQNVVVYNLTTQTTVAGGPFPAGFHTYKLVGGPSGVSLYMDGNPTPVVTNIPGFPKNTASLSFYLTPTPDVSFAQFGSFALNGATSTMYVSHARFTIIPEPATGALACVALIGTVNCRRKRD